MRALFVSAFTFALSAAGAFAFETGQARPGGDYRSADAASAEACARLCEADTICMAWTFRAGACALKAVAPAPIADAESMSGLAARAPGFMRVAAAAPPTPIAEAAPPPAVPAPPQAPARRDDYGLLGGPGGDDPPATTLPIRARLDETPHS